jgi:hypothetical protein
MPEALAIVVVVVALAACVWLSVSTQNQLRQLRAELDQTQRQVNELRAAVEAVPPPPTGLPRTRSSGLDDLRQQLRAAHSEGVDVGETSAEE